MYVDDIYVNESLIPIACVRNQLSNYRLLCKDLERLEDN